ncbi:MAG: adenylate cyclase, partial [Bacteroidales bacterium]|nr:adenylate cyclase [Bacteroidales bacterium]
MGKEIERKFLVKSDVYKTLAQGTYYRQGYVPTLNGMTVRLRIAGEKGY